MTFLGLFWVGCKFHHWSKVRNIRFLLPLGGSPLADWSAGCAPISLGLLQLPQKLFPPDIKPQFGLNKQLAIIGGPTVVYYQRRTYFQLHH